MCCPSHCLPNHRIIGETKTILNYTLGRYFILINIMTMLYPSNEMFSFIELSSTRHLRILTKALIEKKKILF